MKIILIAAMTSDRVIGRDGQLPWHVPEDLKFFKRTTQGHAVIMGRKTYESMGRPLPRRRNIVITRQSDYRPALGASKPSDDPALDVLFGAAGGAIERGTGQTCLDVVHSLTDALELCRSRDERNAFVIGGGEIFAEAMGVADEMFVTRIDGAFPGDTFFPAWSADEWREAGIIDPDFPAAVRFVRVRAD